MRGVIGAIACLTLSLLSSDATASTVAEITVSCPIGGKSFTTTTAMSGSQFGQNLDLKPIGAIVSPWPIPKCPENGFVLYKETFSSAELKRLEPFVLSETYQSLQKTETNYYLAAVLMKHLGAPLQETADALLKATWEAEGGPRYKTYAGEALAVFDLLATPASAATPEQIASYHLLAGEMERRLGHFDSAKRRFDAVLKAKGVSGTMLEQIARQEIALIALGDSATHPVADTPLKRP